MRSINASIIWSLSRSCPAPHPDPRRYRQCKAAPGTELLASPTMKENHLKKPLLLVALALTGLLAATAPALAAAAPALAATSAANSAQNNPRRMGNRATAGVPRSPHQAQVPAHG